MIRSSMRRRRTGSDQSVTSVAPLPVVHLSPESHRLVRPVAPSLAPSKRRSASRLALRLSARGVMRESGEEAEQVGP